MDENLHEPDIMFKAWVLYDRDRLKMYKNRDKPSIGARLLMDKREERDPLIHTTDVLTIRRKKNSKEDRKTEKPKNIKNICNNSQQLLFNNRIRNLKVKTEKVNKNLDLYYKNVSEWLKAKQVHVEAPVLDNVSKLENIIIKSADNIEFTFESQQVYMKWKKNKVSNHDVKIREFFFKGL